MAFVEEGLKIELKLLSVSDANVSILSRDSRQPIITKPQAGGGVFKHVRCSDSSNGMKETNKINIWKICEVRMLIGFH